MERSIKQCHTEQNNIIDNSNKKTISIFPTNKMRGESSGEEISLMCEYLRDVRRVSGQEKYS